MNRSSVLSAANSGMEFVHGYDEALVGYAQRGDLKVPCYSWARGLRWLQGRPAKEVLETLQGLFTHSLYPSPLVLMPVNLASFKAGVSSGYIKTWQQLLPALIGTGIRQFGPEVAVYSYPKVIQILSRMVEPTVDLSLDEFYESQLGSLWLGPGTPWTLHPVQ